MSPLLMFGNFLENLGKSTGECKNKHSDKFPKFLKISRKSLEIFRSLHKSSEKIRKCHKVLKITFQHFQNFLRNLWKSSEMFRKNRKMFCKVLIKITLQHSLIFLKIFGNCWKSSEIFRSLGKKLENVRKFSKRSSDNFWKFSKVFGNAQKISDTLGKFLNTMGSLRKFFYNIPIWHLRTEDRIQEFWFVICTVVTLFALVLHFLHWLLFNCTALSQSELSNFFMYIIRH